MENKPICEVDEYGNKKWYINGKLHREDGPAIEYVNGTKKWLMNNKLHRLDGPAIIWNDGSYLWYINSYNVTNKIHQWAKETDIDLDDLKEEDKALIKLIWSNYE